MKQNTVIFFLIILCSAFCIYSSEAQVTISENNSSTDPSAMLEIKSANKGLLPPRMTETERDRISNPPAGLMIYCIDCVEMQMYNGTTWTNMIGGNATPATIPTITIGTQTWMLRNLNVGTMIAGTTPMADNGILEKYCYDNLEDNCDIYGGLYQWDEMMQYVTTEGVQGVCPTGFHIPSDEEWKTLEMALGMSQVDADSNMQPRGTDQGSQLAGNELLWADGILDQNAAFGSSGFTALPSGGYVGSFSFKSSGGSFWSSSELGVDAWARFIFSSGSDIGRYSNPKSYGYPVRCVQD